MSLTSEAMSKQGSRPHVWPISKGKLPRGVLWAEEQRQMKEACKKLCRELKAG